VIPPGGKTDMHTSTETTGAPSRRTGPLLVILSLLALGAAAPAEGPAPTDDVPGQVLEELRAAAEARASLQEEEAAWAAERERLKLLLESVRAESERFAASAAEARRQAEPLQADLNDLEAERQREGRIRDMLARLAEELEVGLDEVAAGCPPGLVPAPSGAARDPAERFLAAVQQLEGAERRADEAAVQLVSAELDDQPAAVRLLRAGGAAAWWMSLDAARAGPAVVEDGALRLLPAPSPQDREAIVRAFDIADGRSAPEWALLPIARPEAE